MSSSNTNRAAEGRPYTVSDEVEAIIDWLIPEDELEEMGGGQIRDRVEEYLAIQRNWGGQRPTGNPDLDYRPRRPRPAARIIHPFRDIQSWPEEAIRNGARIRMDRAS